MEKKGNFKRIVIKIGSSTLTHKGGKLNLSRIDRLLRQIVDLKNQGREVLFVTSGAIGAGMGEMGLEKKPNLIKEQQAAAAVGQGQLIALYNKFLREYGEKGGQVLLTASDMEDRTRYLNAFNTLDTLLDYGVIPIINENDTVATEEIQFGDNDTLAARVAGLVEADLLINLTDTKGLYNQDPSRASDNLELISRIDKITPEIEKIAGTEGSKVSTGGMQTKIEAAKIAIKSGIMMVIGPGYQENIILEIINMLENKNDFTIGTTFIPEKNSLPKRKQWFRFNLAARGRVKIDRGAEKALLNRGKSLLPGGILETSGNYQRGDLVNVFNEHDVLIAKGLINYSRQEVEQIKGHHSRDISEIIGYINQEEVLHRDNMVIVSSRE
ncbi:MAG: glutamate 5-kinase [bacterium]